ncbi:binding-protein-dependent transport system inner membrane protein [Paenibacillus macerans]|uniref:Putative binding-protein-dependent transport systems inner membrane component n=1 Tax=Paenibacillus macerans TaxID=44252 RepID=A0A090Y435_PAEMA|nr:putative binding-protein-dependent transport systems inner membrane component [Paenibacillus macerans]GIP13776.1 hypothetical protein J1TS5_59460 [Paenibacillus macerans]SUA86359.1 binding-protein-dependent transport system inner membrane protein [Paenibacillus macerans]
MKERNAGELRNPAHKEGYAAREKPAHRPWLAMGLSILFAGLGQLYNRSYIKGIILIILELAFIITFADFIGLGLWGMVTLGTIPKVDHSIFLLVYGLLSLILLAIAAMIYIVNIRDAKKEAELIAGGWQRPKRHLP